VTLAEIACIAIGWSFAIVAICALWHGIRSRSKSRRVSPSLPHSLTATTCDCAYCVARTRYPHLALTQQAVLNLQAAALLVGDNEQGAVMLENVYATERGVGALHYIVADGPTYHRFLLPALQQAAAARPA